MWMKLKRFEAYNFFVHQSKEWHTHSILRNKELTVQMEEVGENFNLPIYKFDNPYCCKFPGN